MKHLQELGLDTSNASMCWIKDTEGNQHLSVHDEYCYEASLMNPVPAYTLQDVLDALPNRIIDEKGFDYFLAIHIYNNIWNVVYSLYNEILVTINYFNSECLIDAAYEMLCWCIENGYVENKKQD